MSNELSTTASLDKPKHYIVRFEGNNSKRWDGKESWVEAEILDELYSEAELVHGAEIMVPWRSKGKITHWKGVFIDQKALAGIYAAYSYSYIQQSNMHVHPSYNTFVTPKHIVEAGSAHVTKSESTTLKSKSTTPKSTPKSNKRTTKASEMPKSNKRRKCELVSGGLNMNLFQGDNKSKATVLQISSESSKEETTANTSIIIRNNDACMYSTCMCG